ncbi:asparagine synthase (glutamine-hydrolyzing) [Heliobacterium undosum]|uniref:asparagine synthase (glutamine-hydrolyzing) n=1 Tax=Heliomicrobium undosum TaxID=121734 RepID=A0A845L9A1_9FIRM|nr:asparagine synthase (glutamine-hydrolyzing) [Heliomicrobium undosum]MZP29501.1 asparagine synthase (glutamine-hydrolyzing) [Heliomicrobium undosum]
MCGFAGLFTKTNKGDLRQPLKRMIDAIAHRGPDDEGFWIKGPAALGFRRLSIIDLEHGHQPMVDPQGRYALVFNGEIYNYVELRECLIREGFHFRTRSDTEVLLFSYIAWGVECLQRLNGMFAFAIVDTLKEEVFIARDRLGIKPLYYHSNDQGLAFASEIKALLQLPGFTADANLKSIGYYLRYMYNPTDETFFQGVYKLEPGCWLRYGRQGINVGRYWDVSFHYDRSRSAEDTVAELRALIEDAVTIHLRADVPLGCHLSGGLDSSTVVCLASRHYPGRIKTFSGKFREDKFYDETEYAKTVSRYAGTEYLETAPTMEDFLRMLPSLVWYMDEPAVGPGIFPQQVVSCLAAEHVKVVLGGQGGDEVFGGYPRYFLTLYDCGSGIGASPSSAGITRKWRTRWNVLQASLRQHGLLATLTKVGRRMQARAGDFESLWERYTSSLSGDSPLLGARLKEQMLDGELREGFLRFLRQAPTDQLFDKMLYHDLKCYLPGLLQVEDRTSMAVSLESRVPLLDYRIVEYASTIPPELKVFGLEPKSVFKQAIAGIIPEEVRRRKDKKGFPTPINLWFKAGARQLLQDILLDPAARQRGLFDAAAISRSLETSHDHAWALWSLCNVELWFKLFIDKDPRWLERIQPNFGVKRT